MEIKSYCYSRHTFLPEDLYEQVDPAKWGITRKFISNEGCRKRQYCGYVLVYFFYLVILDIIENNITFEFPMLGSSKAFLYAKCFSGEDFKQRYARGQFKGIDFLSSEFKGYAITFQWHRGKKIREKPFYINTKIKNWFYDKINKGKQYY